MAIFGNMIGGNGKGATNTLKSYSFKWIRVESMPSYSTTSTQLSFYNGGSSYYEYSGYSISLVKTAIRYGGNSMASTSTSGYQIFANPNGVFAASARTLRGDYGRISNPDFKGIITIRNMVSTSWGFSPFSNKSADTWGCIVSMTIDDKQIIDCLFSTSSELFNHMLSKGRVYFSNYSATTMSDRYIILNNFCSLYGCFDYSKANISGSLTYSHYYVEEPLLGPQLYYALNSATSIRPYAYSLRSWVYDKIPLYYYEPLNFYVKSSYDIWFAQIGNLDGKNYVVFEEGIE